MATDPTQSFAQNISQSGSGFNQKLQAIVGIGQAVKGSQVARQQMRDQFAQQKELIQFRADTELERQVEYNERVTQPQQQAQVRAQQQQQQQKAILDSKEAAEERRREMTDEFHQDFGNLRKYNLFTPYFDVRQNEETGLFEAKVFNIDGEEMVEMDPQQYRYQAETLQEQSQWFERLEEGLDKNWFPEEIPETERTTASGRTRLTADDVRDILNGANNPEEAQYYLQRKDQFSYPSPFELEEPEEGSGGLQGRGENAKFDSATVLSRVNELTDRNGNVEFNFVEQPSFWDKISSLGQAVGDKRTLNINLGQGQTVLGATQQIQEVAQELFDVDLSKLQTYDNAVRNQILAGDTEGLSGDEKDLANTISSIKEDEEMSEHFKKMQTLYFGLPQIENEWRQEKSPASLSGKKREELYLNFGQNSGFGDLFVPASDDQTAQKAYFNNLITQ